MIPAFPEDLRLARYICFLVSAGLAYRHRSGLVLGKRTFPAHFLHKSAIGARTSLYQSLRPCPFVNCPAKYQCQLTDGEVRPRLFNKKKERTVWVL